MDGWIISLHLLQPFSDARFQRARHANGLIARRFWDGLVRAKVGQKLAFKSTLRFSPSLLPFEAKVEGCVIVKNANVRVCSKKHTIKTQLGPSMFFFFNGLIICGEKPFEICDISKHVYASRKSPEAQGENTLSR